MKFLEAFWATIVSNDSPPAAPGTRSPTPPTSIPGAQDRTPSTPRAGIEGLALRSVRQLGGDVFTDPDRVKWVLLQPDVDAAARRFASLASLGPKRDAEAHEARAALRALLATDLPSEWPEHIDMLLDLMQTDARHGIPVYMSEGPPRTRDMSGGQRDGDAGVDLAEPGAPVAAENEPPSEPGPEESGPESRPEPHSDSRPESRPESNATPPDSSAAAPAPIGDGSLTPVEYELHALPGTSVSDIDVGLVGEYIQGSTRRSLSAPLSEIGEVDVMRAVKAIDGPAGRERVTVLGGLFFAAKPERLVVQSKVRFVEFPGVEVASSGEKVAYRYSEEVTGSIPQLIARMEQLHKDRLAPGVLADGFRMEELPAVPLFALREAMVNAVCHRDYSLVGANIQVRLFADRLEIQSPGGLPGPVTVDNILTESYARNPRVADILRDLGYVERHGLGIDNMVKSMEEAHLPPPEFTNCDTSFTVTLRFRPADESDPGSWLTDIKAEGLPHGHQRALVFTRRVGKIVNADYQALNLVDGAEATRQLRGLVRSGWLLQHGTRGQAHYTLGPSSGPQPGADCDADLLPQAVLDPLSASQRRILDIVARHGKVKAGEILDISALKDRRTVQRALAALTRGGLVVRRATSPTDPNASYEVNRDLLSEGPPQDPLF